MRQKKPLAVVGNVNVDLIMGPVDPWPTPGSEVIVEHDELRVGGSAANSALTWAALGATFQAAANTGSDLYGKWLRDGLMPHARSWPVSQSGSTISVGLTHPNGERTFITSRGHLADLGWPEVRDILDWSDLSGGWLLLCGSFLMDRLSVDYDRLFDQAQSFGIRVALDTGWPPDGWSETNRARARHWASRSDCLLLNEVEATTLAGLDDTKKAVEWLFDLVRTDGLVVVKCGKDGALAMHKTGALHQIDTPMVTVTDSIGAGDIFNASFLFSLACGTGLEDAVATGTRTAARAISTNPRNYSIQTDS